jgi:CO dehydrogenase maturation factor
MKIAVTGKGGVGKTFIAGTLAGQYAAAGNKTIAIDADTSPNLALTLGMTEADLEKIIPIAENTSIIEEKTKTDYPGVFKLIFTVDDIIKNQSVQTPAEYPSWLWERSSRWGQGVPVRLIVSSGILSAI